MSRYPGRLERSLNDSFEYERKLTQRIAELEAELAVKDTQLESIGDQFIKAMDRVDAIQTIMNRMINEAEFWSKMGVNFNREILEQAKAKEATP